MSEYELILRQYHAKHPNRFHQFLREEMKDFEQCLVCNVNLKVVHQELKLIEKPGEKRPVWNGETKRILLQALGAKCSWCDETLEEVLEIDHMIPLAIGGTNDIGNLRVLCSNCHIRRHRGEDYEAKPLPVGADIQHVSCSGEMLRLILQVWWKSRTHIIEHITMIVENGAIVGVEDPITGEIYKEPLPEDIYPLPPSEEDIKA